MNEIVGAAVFGAGIGFLFVGMGAPWIVFWGWVLFMLGIALIMRE